MVKFQDLITILADGNYHSGARLGEQLGVSRAAVWKLVKKLESQLGLTVFAVKGKGYRLPRAIEMLDSGKIISLLSPATAKKLSKLEIFFEIDSTNHYLNSKSLAGAPGAYLVLAEHQSQGKGRRGRTWVSPFGGNLYLSLLWRFQYGPAQLGCLGLVVAVAIVRVLHQMGIHDAGVKWPNDIFWHDRKLAGILLEMRGESSGPSSVVIGIGVNIAMPVNDVDPIDRIDQPWVDIESILNEKIERNRFTSLLIDELFKVLAVFPQQQQELLDEWQAMDVLKGQAIEVHFPDKILEGTANGITSDGALCLHHNGENLICHSGEVSIRRG